MAEHDLIDEYLERVRAQRGAPSTDDDLAELRDHLLESFEELQRQGIDARDAQLLALARLGDADEVASSYGARRRIRRPGRAALAGAIAAVAAIGAAGVLVAAPFGNDPELAKRLGFEPKERQEPSGTEIRGVPLPRNVRADDVRWRALSERMAIVDE